MRPAGLVTLLGILLWLSNPSLSRADPTAIAPHGADDWKERHMEGSVTWSAEVMEQPSADHLPLWKFTVDAPQATAQLLELELRFADLGIAPVDAAQAETWNWSWYVRNMKTADYVGLGLIDESGSVLRLAVSHNLYDNSTPEIGDPPVTFRKASAGISGAYGFIAGHRPPAEVPPRPTRIVGLVLTFALPHQQEVWLGPVSYSQDAAAEPLPRRRETRPGRFVVTDIDGDGRVEVLTPWFTNDKLWTWSKAAGRLVIEPRSDALGRHDPYYLVCPGDVDHDGDLDLVAIDPDMEHVRILRQALGRFVPVEPPIFIPLQDVTAQLTCLALADDDGDGALEIFIGYHNLPDNPQLTRIGRLHGKGDGTFGPMRSLPTAYTPRQLWGTYYVTFADLDNDGSIDLLTAAGGMGVQALPGNGDGSYGLPVVLAPTFVNGFFRDVAIADVNGDSLLDLYVSMYSQNPAEEGRNFFCLNDGQFRFREIGREYGLAGTRQTQDACFTELSGGPGLELVVLERDALVAYDMADLAQRLSEGQPGQVASRVITRQASVLLDAYRIACQDLEQDGTVEVLLSHDSGPLVYKVPESGPVWSLAVQGHGFMCASRVRCLPGRGDHPWSTILEANDRVGCVPFLVAVGDSMEVQGPDNRSIIVSGRAGSVQRVTPRSTLADISSELLRQLVESLGVLWARHRGPLLLAAILAVAASVSLELLRRRARRHRADDAWRTLLRLIRISTHASWRVVLGNASITLQGGMQSAAGRGDGDPGLYIAEARKLLPPEFLNSLDETLAIAQTLEVEGARSARDAIRVLARIHDPSPPGIDRLYPAVRALSSRLELMQDLVAERFRCDAEEVCRKVTAFRSRECAGIQVTSHCSESEIARIFPMAAGDLFHTLDELVMNAAKKHPRPTQIVLTTRSGGPQTAMISVWDDGADLATESGRADRQGTRLGLAAVEEILRAYGGKLSVQNALGGGVTAEIRLPVSRAY